MLVEVQQGNQILQLAYEEFEARVVDGEFDARTLIRFEVVTGNEFKAAGELEFFQTLANPRRLQFRRNLTKPATPILTAILVGIQLRLYLLSWFDTTDNKLQERLSNWTPYILEQGESWRLLTYGVLHLSFTHLLFNMFFLAYTGYHLERAIGRFNLALIFVASVFFGGCLSLWFAPESRSIGASAGDFGLMSAAIVMGWKYGDMIPNQSRKFFGWALLPYLGFSIISGLMGTNVDNWSHLGGLMVGITLMTLLDPEVLPVSRTRNRRVRRITCTLMLGITLTFSMNPNRFVPLKGESDHHGWSYSVPNYWYEGWTSRNSPSHFSPTGAIEISHQTRIHRRPLDPLNATNQLIRRLKAESQDLRTVARTAIERNGWQGERVDLDLIYRGQNQHFIGLIIIRGLYEYQTFIRVSKDESEDYELLIRRLLDTVVLTEPIRLTEAQDRRTSEPDSWNARIEFSNALHRAGHPVEAMREWSQLLIDAPESPDALAGWLETQIAYDLPEQERSAEIALIQAPEDSSVIVLAAEILIQAERMDEAEELLQTRWLAQPGDETLEQAMRRWNLDIPNEHGLNLTDPVSK